MVVEIEASEKASPTRECSKIITDQLQKIEHRRIAYFYKNRHLLEGLLPKTRTSYLHKIEKRPNDHHTVPIEKIIDQPTTVTGILKDHQLKGLAFLIWLNKNGLNGILGDEMGLGKHTSLLEILKDF